MRMQTQLDSRLLETHSLCHLLYFPVCICVWKRYGRASTQIGNKPPERGTVR